MLLLNGESFTCGRAKFRDRAPGTKEPTDKIFVEIEFQSLRGKSWLAQLDTGAAYSMLDREIAEALGVLDGDGERVKVITPGGSFQGCLERIPLVLLADEGRSLEVEATFLVSPDWPGKTFLGYTGFLDRLRIALAPPVHHFYFGESEWV